MSKVENPGPQKNTPKMTPNSHSRAMWHPKLSKLSPMGGLQKSIKKRVSKSSKKIVNIIRRKIKFKNLLITDDISMRALKYSVKLNTTMAFNAGCNIVMHCNGKMNEMIIVAQNSPFLSSFIKKKTSQLLKKVS